MKPPGATLGVLGGGQLGRMLALEARRMGYRTIALDPTVDGPAGQFCDELIVGSFSDVDAAVRLAERSTVITLETEHIALPVLQAVEAVRPLYPGSAILGLIQDRLTQRRFLDRIGVPHTRYAEVIDAASLDAALARLGQPAILKTRREGYDGKGQVAIRDPQSLQAARALLRQQPCILEAFVPFEREISCIAARSLDGQFAAYPIAENIHRNHILHATIAPARVSTETAQRAEEVTRAIAEGLGFEGLLAVEFFVLPDGTLLVNEIAPRTHNSGHFTLGACATSQFEQQARCVMGLPLGETTLFTPAVMVNLLGDLWLDRTPHWQLLLGLPNAHLHLYGKAEAKAGRKMGHLLLLGGDIDASLRLADEIVR
jgi:5-(carboxyamino)imidazole ribonucleotide synthase